MNLQRSTCRRDPGCHYSSQLYWTRSNKPLSPDPEVFNPPPRASRKFRQGKSCQTPRPTSPTSSRYSSGPSRGSGFLPWTLLARRGGRLVSSPSACPLRSIRADPKAGCLIRFLWALFSIFLHKVFIGNEVKKHIDFNFNSFVSTERKNSHGKRQK